MEVQVQRVGRKPIKGGLIGVKFCGVDKSQMLHLWRRWHASGLAFEGNIRVIKVITGHGSGKLRGSIRSWCGNQEGRFQAVINGEDYNVFNKVVADMRADINIRGDMDFGRNNTGVTYIWLR